MCRHLNSPHIRAVSRAIKQISLSVSLVPVRLQLNDVARKRPPHFLELSFFQILHRTEIKTIASENILSNQKGASHLNQIFFSLAASPPKAETIL